MTERDGDVNFLALRDVVIEYGLVYHPTVPVRHQLSSYVPHGGARLPPQVAVVDPTDIVSPSGRVTALVHAVEEQGCTLERPIVFIDEGWLQTWMQ